MTKGNSNGLKMLKVIGNLGWAIWYWPKKYDRRTGPKNTAYAPQKGKIHWGRLEPRQICHMDLELCSTLMDRHQHPCNILKWWQKNYAIYQNNEQTSRRIKEVEPVDPVQKNIYQSTTCKKDLSWLHFDDEQRVQEMQQVKDQQSCISVLEAPVLLNYSNKTS